MVRLRALRAFTLLAELGSFRKTAAHLHTTQPAISARIRGLEESLGRKLVHRESRGIRLTVDGLEVLRHAKPIVELTDRLATLFSPEALVMGTVRIGAIDTITMTWLLPLFERLRREHPEVSVELRADTSTRLIEDLRNGEVDVAFVMGPVEDESVINVDVGSYPMAWVANPAKYRFEAPVNVADLAPFPIISYPRGSKPYRTIEAFFGPDTVLRLNCSNSLSTLVRLAVDGLGVAAIPPVIIEREIREGLLAVIPVREPFPGLDCHAAFYGASRSAAPGIIAALAVKESSRYWAERATREGPSG